jgi:hypothetical protein
MSGWSSSASDAVASPQTSAKGSISTGVRIGDKGHGQYPDGQECYLAIAPTGVATFKLSFSKFDTEKDSDFLYIYDGPSTSSTILMSASGPLQTDISVQSSGTAFRDMDEIPGQAVQSSGTIMLLKFVSDDKCVQGGNTQYREKSWNGEYYACSIQNGV